MHIYPQPLAVVSPPPILRASGKTYARNIRKPSRYNDAAPSPKHCNRRTVQYHDEPPPPPPVILPPTYPESEAAALPSEYTSQKTSYGVFRVYPGGYPSWTPTEFSDGATDQALDLSSSTPYFAPFKSASTFRVLHWYETASATKSMAEVDRFIDEVWLADDVNKEDLRAFRTATEVKRLDNYLNTEHSFFERGGWKKGIVAIPLPAEKVKYKCEAEAPKLSISGIYYKEPLEVMKAALKGNSAKQFHNAGYREYWQPSPNVPPERIFSEVYSADVFLNEAQKIRLANLTGSTPHIDTVVCAFMLYSDSTHLTNFGTSSLWPVYIYFGNISKYSRCESSSFSAYHLAYIPKVCYSLLQCNITEP